jgi:ligand-binding sensor domain-containing protein
MGTTISGNSEEILIGKMEGGAVAFDKTTMTNTYYKRFYTPLASNKVSNVLMDELGNMWFACTNVSTNNEKTGICRFDGNSWTVYDSSNSPVPHEDLRYMHVDKNEILWVGTKNKGLLKYDGNLWAIYDTTNSPIPSNEVKTINSDNQGVIWFAVQGENNKDKLIKYDGSNWTILDPDTGSSPYFEIGDIELDANNVVWMLTSKQLMKYDGNIFTNYYYSLAGITIQHIRDLGIDNNGNKYICNRDTGLVVFDQNENWNVYNLSDTSYYNWTFGIYIDEEDVIWLLTWRGLTKFNENVITNYSLCNSNILPTRVDDTFRDSNGNVWFATFSLVKYDGNSWIHFNSENSPIPPNTALVSLDMDTGGNLWIATQLEGLVRLKDTTWTTFTSANSEMPSNFLRELKVDKSNVLWVVGDSGIVKIENNVFTVYNESNAPLNGDYMWAVAIDELNNKWFGGETCGLVKFDGANWTVYDENNSGLYNNRIEDITVDKYGVLWLTTGQAIQTFNGSTWNTYLPTSFGLPNDMCNALQADPYGNVWVSLFFNGFAKIDSARNWTIYNNQNSGLLGTNQIVHRIKIDYDGYKWFCTNDGGVSIYKGDIVLNVSGDENEIPLTFRLEQNYPYPFNPSTTIKFALPVNSKVKINVYNSLGQLVETLVDNEMESGYHEVNFNASKLASGVYLYQLQSQDFISVKKMLLIK